jgi:hypothetical protein
MNVNLSFCGGEFAIIELFPDRLTIDSHHNIPCHLTFVNLRLLQQLRISKDAISDGLRVFQLHVCVLMILHSGPSTERKKTVHFCTLTPKVRFFISLWEGFEFETLWKSGVSLRNRFTFQRDPNLVLSGYSDDSLGDTRRWVNSFLFRDKGDLVEMISKPQENGRL